MQIKYVDSWRLFRKIVRKYTMKRYRKYYAFRHKMDYYFLMNEFVFYDIIGLDALKEFAKTHHERYVRDEILRDAIEYYGKTVMTTCKDGKLGKVVGLEVSPCDDYWIIEHEDGRKTYESCVGRLNFVD